MSKGKGGGSRTGGGGSGGLVEDAVDQVNAVGVEGKSVSYLREGMRDVRGHIGAFAGATKGQATAIATGRSPTRDWGKKFAPIKLEVEYMRPGRKPAIYLTDGRHRMTAARNAGATRIRAEIRVSRKTKSGWVDSKPVIRNVRIRPK